jgi:hypothetical protein
MQKKEENESKMLHALCWISYCDNNRRNVERGSLQIMKCNSVMNALNPSTKKM